MSRPMWASLTTTAPRYYARVAAVDECLRPENSLINGITKCGCDDGGTGEEICVEVNESVEDCK
jgi:hypothetical protein